MISSQHLPALEPADTWRSRALCGLRNLPPGLSPELWFTDLAKTAAVEQAKEICTRCPVRRECLENALAEEGGRTGSARPGIRAGLTGQERNAEYRRRRDWAKAPP